MTDKEALERTKEVLDTIDIKEFFYHIRDNWNAYNLTSAIEEYLLEYNPEIIEQEPFDGDLFNCMNISEFIDYLYERYGKDVYVVEEPYIFMQL